MAALFLLVAPTLEMREQKLGSAVLLLRQPLLQTRSFLEILDQPIAVPYTHLTLPTNRDV